MRPGQVEARPDARRRGVDRRRGLSRWWWRLALPHQRPPRQALHSVTNGLAPNDRHSRSLPADYLRLSALGRRLHIKHRLPCSGVGLSGSGARESVWPGRLISVWVPVGNPGGGEPGPESIRWPPAGEARRRVRCAVRALAMAVPSRTTATIQPTSRKFGTRFSASMPSRSRAGQAHVPVCPVPTELDYLQQLSSETGISRPSQPPASGKRGPALATVR